MSTPTACLLKACAWCCNLKLGGDYLPMGLRENIHEIDLADGHHHISHGICERCRTALERTAEKKTHA